MDKRDVRDPVVNNTVHGLGYAARGIPFDHQDPNLPGEAGMGAALGLARLDGIETP